MDATTDKKVNRYSDRVIGRAIIVTLILFVGAIPLSISATPGMSLVEQVGIALGVSAIAVLLGVLMLGIAVETAQRIRVTSDACLKAVRGDAREKSGDVSGDAMPTAG